MNAAAIIAGGLLGLVLNRMSQGIRNTVMQGIGMALVVLGLSMALKSNNFLLVVASLVVGGILGELIQVEKRLEQLGGKLEQGVELLSGLRWRRGKGDARLAQGFTELAAGTDSEAEAWLHGAGERAERVQSFAETTAGAGSESGTSVIRAGEESETIQSFAETPAGADRGSKASADTAPTASGGNADGGEAPKAQQGRLALAFVNTTLIYCVGAMAILGALDGGLRGQHDILYTKSMLDGFTAIIFASTMGVGVLFSAIPVFLYQGMIALAASGIAAFIQQELLDEIIVQITAVGGILIMGIGINLLEIRKIRVANLLPSLLAAVAAVLIMHGFAS